MRHSVDIALLWKIAACRKQLQQVSLVDGCDCRKQRPRNQHLIEEDVVHVLFLHQLGHKVDPVYAQTINPVDNVNILS